MSVSVKTAHSDTGRVGALALPTVWVDLLDLVGTNLGFLRVELLLFGLHLAPLVAQHYTDGPVVLARMHVGVLSAVLLGKQHEPVHGPSGLGGVWARRVAGPGVERLFGRRALWRHGCRFRGRRWRRGSRR